MAERSGSSRCTHACGSSMISVRRCPDGREQKNPSERQPALAKAPVDSYRKRTWPGFHCLFSRAISLLFGEPGQHDFSCSNLSTLGHVAEKRREATQQRLAMSRSETSALAPNSNPEVSAAPRLNHDALQVERERKNFVRAAAIAASLGLPPNQLRDLQFQALWQMAVNRNAPGTRRLAQQFGVSGRELKEFLEERVKHLGEAGNVKAFNACYDTTTGRYLSFREWMQVLTEDG